MRIQGAERITIGQRDLEEGKEKRNTKTRVQCRTEFTVPQI